MCQNSFLRQAGTLDEVGRSVNKDVFNENRCDFWNKWKIKLICRVQIIAFWKTQLSFVLAQTTITCSKTFSPKWHGLMKYCTPLDGTVFNFFLYIDFLCNWTGHCMLNIPPASVNSVFELLNGCFISERAICSINVWLPVKYCFWSFEFKPGESADPLNCDC